MRTPFKGETQANHKSLDCNKLGLAENGLSKTSQSPTILLVDVFEQERLKFLPSLSGRLFLRLR